MQHTLILTGDINLLGVADPAVPFAKVAADGYPGFEFR